MPTKSSTLFSIGVPVSAQLRRRGIEQIASLVVLRRFFDPLRFVDDHQVEGLRNTGRVRLVAHQQFVVGEHHTGVGVFPQPLAARLLAFDDG